MPIRDILTLRFRGQCKYCLTDDSPFLFCAEPVATLPDGNKSVYCLGHHLICYRGQGVAVELIEGMMHSAEGTVRRAAPERTERVPVDVQIRGRE